MDIKKSITIFTPTYNRAYILPQLYNSLINQTSQDFIWLVVDDGSTDTTKEIIEGWKKEEKIVIEYYKQENGGKQRAHNTAVTMCHTDLFICIDSDDYLTDEAVEVLLSTWHNLPSKEHLSGIITLKGYDETTPIGTEFPAGIEYSSQTELYQKHGFEGETALLYKTEILKNYLYDVAEGEKFITESYVFIQIDQRYTMYILNAILNICEYQTDGYTKNIFKVIYNNPKSYMRHKWLSVKLAKTFKYKLLNSINLLSAYFINRNNPREFDWNMYTILCYIPGYLLYLKRFKKYRTLTD